ncbi:MAG: sulfoacetaldehyde dehydrogenase, partial [Caldimonas sp.]
LALAAERVVRSKTFDNATSCSSENSLVIVDAVYEPMLAALAERGAVLLDTAQKNTLQRMVWRDGRLSPAAIGQSAAVIAARAGALESQSEAERHAWARLAERAPTMLMVEESGVGHEHPYSGEKLSPVLALYRAADFDAAAATVERIYAYEGAGHSVGLHSRIAERALQLGLTLPVSRVIVDQAHCIATGGSFDNGLPFSLSMGCGTWGKNNFSDNLNYRHFLNITRISRPIAERVPTETEIFGDYFARYGTA